MRYTKVKRRLRGVNFHALIVLLWCYPSVDSLLYFWMWNLNDFTITCSNSDIMQGSPRRNLCRSLWIGNSPGDNYKSIMRVLMIVSHCLQGLERLPKYLDGVDKYNLTIFTKYDIPVTGIPNNTTLIRIPNVGRNDHTFACAISHLNEWQTSLRSGDVVVFLKDDMSSSNIH